VKRISLGTHWWSEYGSWDATTQYSHWRR